MAERLSRETVVERASALADEIGLEQLTITKLGRELGIAPPGVYRHVADLDDLRRAVSRSAAIDAAAALSVACTGLSGAAALGAVASTVREWAASHPGRYSAMQIAPDQGDTEGQAAAETLSVVITQALRAYRLSGDDLTDAIRLIRSTVHGFAALEAAGGFKQPRDLDATFERVVGALDVVLQGWASASN